MMINKFGGFEIAEYKEADFQSLAEIFKETYVQTYPHFDKKFHKLKRFEAILSENTLLNTQVWVAKNRRKMVGFIALGQNEIDQLYILPSFQNSGLGSFWINQAKLIHPEFLELYTFECNKKAIEFYKKHNFKIIKRSIAPDEKNPDVKMRWVSSK